MKYIIMITSDYDDGRSCAPGDTGGCPWQRATWRKESLCLDGESIIGVNEDDDDDDDDEGMTLYRVYSR